MSASVCIITNCNRSAPASEPFCSTHRDLGPKRALVDLTKSPFIEELTPTNDQWIACETTQDRYDLMKACVRQALALGAIHSEAG